MPLELGDTINKISDKLMGAPFMDTIMRNPIYTAMLITFIIVIIIMFIFRDAETDESLLMMCLRSGFYIFVVATGVILLNNRVLMTDTTKLAGDSEIAQVFDGGATPPYAPSTSLSNGINTVYPSVTPSMNNIRHVDVLYNDGTF